MSKPTVFISHITEEKDLAEELKSLIESSFLGMLDVFVSSDATSIQAGAKWLDNITSALKSCSIELILCSPKSIKRPWINFEAGAGWIRDIPVIPLCHSGIEPNQLPIPLNLLQVAKVSEISSLKLIFPVLAQAIGAKIPNINFSDFVDRAIKFERQYMLGDSLKKLFDSINSDMNAVYNYLDINNQIITLDLTVGFISTEKINLLRCLESNELDGYIQVSVKNHGISITNSGAINGADVSIKILNVAILKEFRHALLG